MNAKEAREKTNKVLAENPLIKEREDSWNEELINCLSNNDIFIFVNNAIQKAVDKGKSFVVFTTDNAFIQIKNEKIYNFNLIMQILDFNGYKYYVCGKDILISW